MFVVCMHLTHLLLVVATKALDSLSQGINQPWIHVLGTLFHFFELTSPIRPFLGALPSPKRKFSLSKEKEPLPPLAVGKSCLWHCLIHSGGFGTFLSSYSYLICKYSLLLTEFFKTAKLKSKNTATILRDTLVEAKRWKVVLKLRHTNSAAA